MPGQTKKFMNQSEFAKALGVSQPMVSKYIRNGCLDGCYIRKGRQTLIDYEAAIEVLPGRLDPSRHGKVNATGGEPQSRGLSEIDLFINKLYAKLTQF